MDKQIHGGALENLVSTIDADVVILRAQPNWTNEADLMILGLQRFGKRHKVFGQIAVEILQQTACPTIMISHRG